MLALTILLLVIAAFIGLFLLVSFLANKPLSLEAVIIHGMFTEAGFILVLVKAYYAKFNPLYILESALLAMAALGGLSLVMFFHLRGKKIPAPLVFGHAGIGLVAFLVLVAKALLRA
jgi:hypothetical protein